MGQQELHDKILALVKEYCDKYHNQPKNFHEGDRISYASRVYDHEEMCNLVDSALEFWLTSGRYVQEFEAGLSKYLGVKYTAVVNSGSSANLLAFMTLTSPLLKERRIQPGDEVITVAAGFPTTVSPIINYGAVPVFVDVTIPQYNIDTAQLEEALSEKTKAVMIAHTLGNPFDLQAVKDFCQKHNLWLIEDNCDALGSTYELAGVAIEHSGPNELLLCSNKGYKRIHFADLDFTSRNAKGNRLFKQTKTNPSEIIGVKTIASDTSLIYNDEKMTILPASSIPFMGLDATFSSVGEVLPFIKDDMSDIPVVDMVMIPESYYKHDEENKEYTQTDLFD